MSKRRRDSGYLTHEDGKSAAKSIIRLATMNLIREDRVSDLPFPGIGLTPGRPPVELVYVGSYFVFDLAEFFYTENRKPRLLIAGPRGFGKSSDLRALACYLHSGFALDKTKDVLVSIWNLDAAVLDEVQVVKDALLFAYLVKWEGQLIVGPLEPAEGYEKTLEQEEEDEEEDEEEELEEEDEEDESAEVLVHEEEARVAVENEGKVVPPSPPPSAGHDRSFEAAQAAVESERKVVTEQINKISSIQEAIGFVEARKKEQGETFHFFADGWEVFDTDNKTDRPKLRQKVQTLLEDLFSHGSTTILALSAGSTILRGTRRDTHTMTKAVAFNEKQYKSYKELSILGQLDPIRSKDIDFYTGRCPLLLETLLECCHDFGRQALTRVHEGGRTNQKAVFRQALPELYPKGDKLAQMLLNDDGAWAAVLSMFRDELSDVRTSIDRIKLEPGEECRSMAAMGAKDGTYFIVSEGRYCSGFIERMYVEGFRRKEAPDNMRGPESGFLIAGA